MGYMMGKLYPLHEKPYFLFANVLKRCSFQKNCTGIWSFLNHQKRWFFLFPKIWSYSLDTKRKMLFLKKNTWKCNIFFNCSEKMLFPRNSRLNGVFIVISGKMAFLFSRKYAIFCLDGKWKNKIVIKIRLELWYFLYTRVGITSITLSSWQKNKDALAPKKYT